MDKTRRGLLAAIAATGVAGCFGGGGGGSTPTETANRTATNSATATTAPTDSPTDTPRSTDTVTPTQSSTDSPTPTQSPSPTATDSPTPSPTPTATPAPRRGTWTHPGTGHRIRLVVTDVFGEMTVERVNADLVDSEFYVYVFVRAKEHLQQVGARATARGDLPRNALGEVKFDHQSTGYATGVKPGERESVSAVLEYHESIERIDIILDDAEKGPNSTPTPTETPCDGIWCS